MLVGYTTTSTNNEIRRNVPQVKLHFDCFISVLRQTSVFVQIDFRFVSKNINSKDFVSSHQQIVDIFSLFICCIHILFQVILLSNIVVVKGANNR